MSEKSALTMTTYKLADGELTRDEFGWVTDLDYFDDNEAPVELVREVWVRHEVETITHHPPTCFCSTCSPDEGEDES